MKFKPARHFPLTAIIVSLAGISSPLQAADQTYDAANATNSWDLTTLNWDASAAAWTNGNSAIFGGTAETVEVNGAITLANLTFSTANFIIAPGTGTLSLAAGTSTVTATTGTSTISALISGNGMLTKAGTGRLNLTNVANTFSGGTTITAGDTYIAGAGVGAPGVPTAGPLGTGVLTLSGGQLVHTAETTIYNNIVAQAATTTTLLETSTANFLNLYGNISGSGSITLNANANYGGTKLWGDNSLFTGTLIVGGSGSGRHKFASASAGSASAKWVLSGTTDSGSMSFGTGTIHFGELSGTAASIRNNSTGTSTLSVGALGTNSTWGGVISNVGTLALTKVGAGTLTVTAANTYNGATTINGGKLDVTTGGIANTPVTVNDTATLQLGSGTKNLNALTVTAGGTAKFGGISTVANALVANGANATLDLVNGNASASLGVSGAAGLTLGGATVADTAKINLEVAGVATDTISVINGLVVDAGGVRITVTDLGIQANQSYTLLSFFGGSGAGFAIGTGTTVGAITLANPNLAFGVTGTLEVTADSVILRTSGAAAPGAAYWSGAKGANWTDGLAGQGNFKSGPLASAPFLAANPGAATQVFFSNDTAGNLTNTLGGNFDILGLTYRAGSPAVSTAGTHQLTLEEGGITVESGSGGATLAMSSLVLGQNQIWSNRSATPLTVAATTVTGGTSELTMEGTGGVRLGGTSFSVGTLTLNTSLDLKGTSLTAGLLDSTANITNTGTANSTITANINTETVLSGIISDGGAGTTISITKGLAGFLTLGGANTYSGGTTLAGGTLKAGNDAAFGTGPVSITSATAVLDLNGKSVGNPLNNSGTGAVITNSAATPATVSSGFNAAGAAAYVIGDFTVNGTGDIVWNGAIRRTTTIGTLTKGGDNTLTINDDFATANSLVPSVFGGMSLRVEAGTVFFGKTVTSINDLLINGGTLKMDPNYQVSTAGIWQGTIGNTITMNGGTWDLNDTGNNGVSNRSKRISGTGGTITNSGTGSSVVVFAARDVAAPAWAGNIQDGPNGGTVALTITNGGTNGQVMQFSGTSTYSGATNIDRNTLQAASATALSGRSSYILTNNAASVLDVNGFNNSVGSLSGGVNSKVALGAAILTIGFEGSGSTFDGVISGTGGIVVAGGGALFLNGTNTYTGNTTVTEGSLYLKAPYLADSSSLVLGKNGFLTLDHTGTDVVVSLVIDGESKSPGVYDETNSGGHILGSGKIEVIAAASYSNWATANAGGQAANLDYDNDGVRNGVEYFMGATGSSFTANPSIQNNKVVWPKDPAFSGSYTVQTSPDLVTWTDAASTLVGNNVECQVPQNQGRVFIRLNVTPN